MSKAALFNEDCYEVNEVAYSKDYGVEFSPLDQKTVQDFSEIADKLVVIRSDISPDDQEAQNTAFYAFPSHLLNHRLTDGQKALINSLETPKIADYVVGVQSELAKVPIKENMERLVNLQSLFSDLAIKATFSDIPFHEACGEWAGKGRQFWARESFAARLAIFGTMMNGIGLSLHIEDAFRPVGVQEGLFRRRVEWTKRDYPDWTQDQIIQEAMSKTAIKPRLASHKAGAAIDARLRDLKTDELLDFGHDYPDGGAIVFPKSPFITPEQWINRNIFNVGSQLCGLKLYVGEDWHISYGDNLASLDHNGKVDSSYTAMYGPIKSFNTDTDSGEILEVYKAEELDRIFDF